MKESEELPDFFEIFYWICFLETSYQKLKGSEQTRKGFITELIIRGSLQKENELSTYDVMQELLELSAIELGKNKTKH